MSTDDEKILFFLKFSQQDKYLPLKPGINMIKSDFFSENPWGVPLLFNIHIVNECEIVLRTFDYFPLYIQQNHCEIPEVESIFLSKQSIFKLNSILTTRIFPFNSQFSEYFCFLPHQKPPKLSSKQEINFYPNIERELIKLIKKKKKI
jgi:hypothetical protein